MSVEQRMWKAKVHHMSYFCLQLSTYSTFLLGPMVARCRLPLLFCLLSQLSCTPESFVFQKCKFRTLFFCLQPPSGFLVHYEHLARKAKALDKLIFPGTVSFHCLLVGTAHYTEKPQYYKQVSCFSDVSPLLCHPHCP